MQRGNNDKSKVEGTKKGEEMSRDKKLQSPCSVPGGLLPLDGARILAVGLGRVLDYV